ncbi:MAG: outer membrane protein assembly factor BamA [Elusimicrobia bacterium]|nr:outer membrane protein assembly factor BamA [Elusimicrobiota bacterium]
MKFRSRSLLSFLFFLFTLHTLLFTSFLLASDYIERIEVSGNKTVKTKKILSQISSRAGDIYNEDVLLDDTKKIYDIGKFEDVVVDVSTGTKGAVVRFIVKEKPRLKKIKFVGNRHISSSKILEKVIQSRGDYFETSDIMDAIKSIQQLYREEGFSQAQISHYIGKPDAKGREVITFYIQEGAKSVVKKLNIFGVKSFKLKKIKALMKTREKKVFNSDKLKDDVSKIEKFYGNRGFARMEISKPYVSFGDGGKSVFVSIFLYENGRYRIGKVSYSGNKVKSLKELAAAMKETKFASGEIYSKKREDELLEKISRIYGDDGYLKVLIDPQHSFRDGKIDINFAISEGPQIFINKIFIEGNRRTKDFVIRREIHVKEGDPFKLSVVRESQRRIFNLGYFSDIRILPTETHLPNRMDLTFKVQEQQTGMLTMGAGYSSTDRLVGTLQVSETNFRGMGQKLSVMWEFGKQRKNYNISFTEPYLFGRKVSFNSSLYNLQRYKEYESETISTDYYWEHKKGASVGFGKKFREIYSLNLTYSFESIKLTDVDSDYMIEQQQIADERGMTSSVRTSFTRDSRDYFWDPSRGSFQKISEEVATGLFGGQNYFHRERFQTSFFLTLVWKLVFVTNFKFGAVHGYGSTKEVPVYERFYVGGGESIRGYDYRGEIGPYEGGRFMNVNNIELKFPLVREKNQTVLQWAFFFDFGGCWADYDDVKWGFGESENNFKRGYGMGIRFKIPAFPVRLDWARGLDHRQRESETQWYFTIGDIFW